MMVIKRLLFVGASCLILAVGIQFYVDSLIAINQEFFLGLFQTGLS